MGSTTTSSRGPISMPYDTRVVANGPQPLTATVRDAAGNSGTTTVSVNVSNAATQPLSAAFSSPAAGATVSGTVTVGMAASGGSAPYTYTLTLDGAQLVSGASATYSWNTATSSNGAHTLGLTVRDAAGATATTSRAVTVQNGNGTPAPPAPPPPTGTLGVFITSPSNGTTVSGTSWVTLWLNGASGTSNTYTLTVGSQTVGTTTTSSTGPVSIPWSTASVPDGAQTLTASARDASGNTGAASIAITVANGGAPAPPPPPAPGGTLKVFITSPASGATVSGTVWVNVWVEGAAAGAKVFTLGAGGTTVDTTTDSGVHVTLPWNTPGTPNGASTLSATVQDASGASGSTSLPVTVGN
jgi:Bacterial Ig domain